MEFRRSGSAVSEVFLKNDLAVLFAIDLGTATLAENWALQPALLMSIFRAEQV